VKILIATLSCHSLRLLENEERYTWVKEIPQGVDHKFFLGNPNLDVVYPDEVFLNVGDYFQDVTKKTVAMYKWVLESGYDYVFKCDLDTLVRPDLLLKCGFENHDYMGGQNSFFASGGAGYWLSRKAMQYVVRRPVTLGPEEDVHVAQSVIDNGLRLQADTRFKYLPGDVMDDQTITYHLGSIKGYEVKTLPGEMLKVWEDQKNRNYKAYISVPAKVLQAQRSVRFRRLN
jgi:hypothetical protein